MGWLLYRAAVGACKLARVCVDQFFRPAPRASHRCVQVRIMMNLGMLPRGTASKSARRVAWDTSYGEMVNQRGRIDPAPARQLLVQIRNHIGIIGPRAQQTLDVISGITAAQRMRDEA